MNKMILVAALALAVAAPVAQAAPSAPTVTLQNNDMLSSNVVGMDVYDGSKTNIGKIKDIAFNADKTVKAYVLSVGGFLGMGTRYVTVAPDQVTVAYDANDKRWHATMNVTKDELKTWPEFKYEGQWNASKS